MNIKIYFAIFSAFFIALLSINPANAQIATQCDISFGRNEIYTGACWFKASNNGSFEIILSDNHQAQEGINLNSITYSATGPNRGTVIGMLNEGGDEWGTFTAMGRQMVGGQPKTCWQGNGTRICIYR